MSHVRTLLTSATALVAAAALAVPADARPGAAGGRHGHPDRPTPGAPGIGDPYFPTEGNGGYDVRHYGIALDYRPATDLLRATTTISARATQALSSFNLDFHGLTVRSVRVDGDRARFSRSGDEMTVTPRRPLKDHARFRVVVSYSGVPQAIDDPQLGLNGWINTDDGALVAGQPYGAATWFPVNDHPLDKATYSFRATVPRGLEAVANGRLVSRRSAGGSTTWRYEATDPMASYLATVDIGEFDLTSRTVAGIHYLDALDPDLDPAIATRIRASLAREPEIVGFLSSQFGRYPWRESGAIIDDLRIGFALETQTRPVYSFLFWSRDQAGGDSVVVHELAHQWYGDSVAVARWQDIWLNEGFATYAEWLWGEHEGTFTPQEAYDDLLAGIPPDDDFWQLAIGDPGPDHLFDGPVYDRGAMTLQALRNRIGDRTFFTLLRRWASEHRDGHGTTPAFVALAERLSGQQLDDLFDVWLSAGYPGGVAASSRPDGRATTGLPDALAARPLRR